MLRWFVVLPLVATACGPTTSVPAPENVASAPASALATETGLHYQVLKMGTGPSPRAGDKVTVHYTGWTTDGKMFDSSVQKGRPFRTRVGEGIAGWNEALLLMRAGSKVRLWIPEELAYQGDEGYPAGTLVFDVQLISVD